MLIRMFALMALILSTEECYGRTRYRTHHHRFTHSHIHHTAMVGSPRSRPEWAGDRRPIDYQWATGTSILNTYSGRFPVTYEHLCSGE